MTTTTNTNGRTRKSLADQIDRLDGILDGLSDALGGAVAVTVQEAVGIAVKEAVGAVLTEVISNRELQEQLLPARPPDPVPPPADRHQGGVKGVLQRTADRVRNFVTACVAGVRRVAAGARGLVLAGGGMVAAHLARSQVGKAVAWAAGWGKSLVGKAGMALGCLLPAFVAWGR